MPITARIAKCRNDLGRQPVADLIMQTKFYPEPLVRNH
ncbi:hypothetical protein LAUMK4_04324 [Mycobacterium persicum]|uniref:Uncharacterized protein n=1 Tax=Mycobacterium persicum TaxID=1487726 RepID=A0AB38UXM7_9MYCO|nr:hypothetical protein LAUMK15_04733 [Mycobacterium persicum]VAZ85559.1 hypothetical protein LAUMK42_04396 [Mycobacterium persicum]VAZ98713.1 hypothetical protein LAUMK4_04324 [Mycobacterium persicum]